MSDQTDQPCPTSLFVSEANVFSMAWTSSTMGNDEIIRSYSNGTSVMKYLDDNCATGAETEKRNNTKSGFRHIPHIPHSVRPAFQVARRNARERRRVQSVSELTRNDYRVRYTKNFLKNRSTLPFPNFTKSSQRNLGQ